MEHQNNETWKILDTKNNDLSNLVDFCIISYGNSIYTFGGYEKKTNQITNQLRQLNFDSKTWDLKKLEEINGKISHSGIIRNSKLYILGGSRETYLSHFQSYDFDIETVSTLPSFPQGITGHSCILNERDYNLYVVGGNLANGSINTNLFCFDFKFQKWNTLPVKGNCPALVDHTCIYHGSKMYCFGGTEPRIARYSNDIFEFDFKTAQWKKLFISGPSKPAPRSRHACSRFHNSFIIHGGTSGRNVFLNDIWIFDLDTFTWTEVNQNSKNNNEIPSPRVDHQIIVFKNKLYLYGGRQNNGNNLNENTIYKFSISKNSLFSKFQKTVYFKKSQESIGNIYSFGLGENGNLGHENRENGSVPKRIESLLNSKIIKISSGENSSACITSNGSLYVWGDSSIFEDQKAVPTQIPELKNEFVLNVYCGNLQTFVILADEFGQPGPVYAWYNEMKSKKYFPKLVTSLCDKKIVDVACTTSKTLVLTNDSFIFSWSNQNDTQLELICTNEKYHFTKITCGKNHSLLLTSEGTILSFGIDCTVGQLGRNLEKNSEHIPSEIEYFQENNIKIGIISCGDFHSLVVTEYGELYSFGFGQDGQLGHDDQLSQFYPKKIKFLNGKRIFQAAAGCSHSVALCETGEIFGFGSNFYSQLGLEEETKFILKPQLLNFHEPVFQVSCGSSHTLFLAEKDENFETTLKEINPSSALGSFAICPTYILYDIFLYLDFKEIGRLAIVSSIFKTFSEKNEIWDIVARRKFPNSNLAAQKENTKRNFRKKWILLNTPNGSSDQKSMLDYFSNIGSLFSQRKDFRIILQGLDASGKTTILYKLKLGETILTIPTIGFNVETVRHRNVDLTFWDCGGGDKIRPLWRHYYCGSGAIIWVIDSTDIDRMYESKQELFRALTDELLLDSILLIFANKQDLPDCMSVEELTEYLEIDSVTNRSWFLQPCYALSGEGLYEGLNWLTSTLLAKEKQKK